MAGKVSRVTYTMNDDGSIHHETQRKGEGKNRGSFLMSDNCSTGSCATPKAAAAHLLATLSSAKDADPSNAPVGKKTKVNDDLPANDDVDGASDRGL